jgi:Family of unknown function (DUF6084)
MADLEFTVEKVEPVRHAAAPMLNFSLALRDTVEESIEAIVLCCQIRIEPARREYRPPEQERLLDLFGQPSRWGQTLRPMLWTHASVVVPAFTGNTKVDLPVPCTYDFNIAATKFFHALDGGEVPLRLLFSGTVFQHGQDDALRISRIPWEKETTFGLPVATWKAMMDIYYPNTQWLDLRKDVFEQLYQYKRRNGLPTLESAIEKLIQEAAAELRP